jgi:hypothetical protein
MNEPHSPQGRSDTSAEARRIRRESLSRLSFADRLALIDDLTLTVQRLARSGLEERFPEASPDDIDRRYAELVLGRTLATAIRDHLQKSGRREGP